jgi:hypothetical protein
VVQLEQWIHVSGAKTKIDLGEETEIVEGRWRSLLTRVATSLTDLSRLSNTIDLTVVH